MVVSHASGALLSLNMLRWWYHDNDDGGYGGYDDDDDDDNDDGGGGGDSDDDNGPLGTGFQVFKILAKLKASRNDYMWTH